MKGTVGFGRVGIVGFGHVGNDVKGGSVGFGKVGMIFNVGFGKEGNGGNSDFGNVGMTAKIGTSGWVDKRWRAARLISIHEMDDAINKAKMKHLKDAITKGGFMVWLGLQWRVTYTSVLW